MKKLAQIYDDFYDLPKDDYTEIIKLFESNNLLLDNKNKFVDKTDFDEYMLLITAYIFSLEHIGKYNKSLHYANKAINLINKNSTQFNLNQNKYIPYWNIMMIKGRAHYNLKQYKPATIIFKAMYNHDSENDYVKKWLDASKENQRSSINKYFYISSLFMMLFSYLPMFNTNKVFLLKLGMVLLIIATINTYFGDKILKWIKN